MALRAFTTFAAGTNVEEAYRSAVERGGPVTATSGVREVEVPPGADPSKLGTLIQRVAQDPFMLDDVPDDQRQVVTEAAELLVESTTCLGIAMDGAVGERMKARLDTGPEDVPYLLFGLVEEP